MLLSIITINYNNRIGLQLTIESVINQICHDFEWIVIDGGSTDGSRELITQNKKYISYWCSEPDKGVYNAMNKGVGHAHGDYVLFLNSGDLLCSNTVLADLSNILTNSTEDFLVGNTIYVDDGGKEVLHRMSPEKISAAILFKTALCHQSTLIRRELLQDEPYDETLKYVSDWKHMFQQIVFNNKTYKKLHSYISKYDYTGMSSVNESSVVREREMVLHEFLPKLVCEDYKKFTKGSLVFLDREKNRKLYDFAQIFLSKSKWNSVKVFIYSLFLH